MKNRELWQPSKFVQSRGYWCASRDPLQVARQSRLMADILAAAYSEALSRYAFGDLLDHGCGQFPLLAMYENCVDSVEGIDWQNSPHDINHADAIGDLNFSMPYDDESFDTVLSSDVIEHLWNPIGVMNEFWRVLRPGGVIVLGTPFNYWLHEEPHDYFRWSPHAVRKLASKANFDVVEMRYCGGHREVLCDTLLKILGRENRSWLVSFLDTLTRSVGLVSVDRKHPDSMTLGTVSVLRKAEQND